MRKSVGSAVRTTTKTPTLVRTADPTVTANFRRSGHRPGTPGRTNNPVCPDNLDHPYPIKPEASECETL